MSAFYVIDSEMEGYTLGTKTAHGPFENRRQAELWIAEDFEGWWKTSDLPLIDRTPESCGTYYIIEQVAEVRPVWKQSVKVKVEEVE